MENWKTDLSHLKKALDAGQEKQKQVEKLISELEQDEESLSQLWEGEAAESFRNGFRQDLSGLRESAEGLARLQQWEASCITGYQEAESQASAAAGKLKIGG